MAAKGNKKNARRQGENYDKTLMQFVRSLIRQMTYNTRNSSSANKTRNYSAYKREDIIKWLQSPTSNEKSLRTASQYMYTSSMQYQRLLKYYAGLYTGAYVISPLAFNREQVKQKPDVFTKQYRKVTKILEVLNIPEVLFITTLIALIDGAYYGVLLSDNSSAFLQTINPDYCKITAICDNSFLYSVDMTKISNSLEFYPSEFTAMYNNYLKTGERWQEVPLNVSFCIKADASVTDFSIPPFAAVMPSLYRIENAEALRETADELSNYKMLAGQIPSDDHGNPLMDEAIVEKYYSHIANALDERVGLALTPFKFDQFSFEGKDGAKDVSDISNVVANFWATAGSSGLLHGQANDTAGVTKLAIKNDETYVINIIQQFQRLINRFLKTSIGGVFKFKIMILPVTVFNKEEYLKYYKEAVSFGLGKSYYAATLGIPQFDIDGLEYMEENLLPFKELTPLKSSYNTSSEDIGRPEEDETEMDTSGQQTRDDDTNANR